MAEGTMIAPCPKCGKDDSTFLMRIGYDGFIKKDKEADMVQCNNCMKVYLIRVRDFK